MTAKAVYGIAIGDSFVTDDDEVLTVLSFITPGGPNVKWMATVQTGNLGVTSIAVEELQHMREVFPLSPVSLRFMKLSFYKQDKTDIELCVINKDAPDQQEIFTSMRDKIGDKPPVGSWFVVQDMETGKRYDLAVRFTKEYMAHATPLNVQTDYQIVANAVLKLIKKLDEREDFG